MNKRVNTILFVLGATVVNIIIMSIIFVTLLFAVTMVVSPELAPELGMLVFLVLFVVSIAATYLIYHKGVKYIAKKVDLNQYFDPIFPKSSKGSSGKPSS